MTRIVASIFLVLLSGFSASAQDIDTTIMGMHFTMDEVVIKAAKKGWDVDGFIRRMKTDTTFYKAFLGLKVVPYTSDNEITFYDEAGKNIAHLENRTEQTAKAKCKTVRISNEKVSGNYFDKKKQPRYYTSQLLHNLFAKPCENECGISDLIAQNKVEKTRMDKNIEQLKQLVFNPGSKISGVPLVGNKASIFDEKISAKYEFKLKFVSYNGDECYLFQAIPKEAYKNDVVFNQLDTWFRIDDFAIVARDYALSYHTLLYDFDVKMKVRLEKVGKRLLPSTIDYSGNWHVLSQKRERAKFRILFDY